jgi:hypothetical protein
MTCGLKVRSTGNGQKSYEPIRDTALTRRMCEMLAGTFLRKAAGRVYLAPPTTRGVSQPSRPLVEILHFRIDILRHSRRCTVHGARVGRLCAHPGQGAERQVRRAGVGSGWAEAGPAGAHVPARSGFHHQMQLLTEAGTAESSRSWSRRAPDRGQTHGNLRERRCVLQAFLQRRPEGMLAADPGPRVLRHCGGRRRRRDRLSRRRPGCARGRHPVRQLPGLLRGQV